MIKFCKAMNTWIFTFWVFGLSFSVLGKTDPPGERKSLKILSYNIKHGRGMDGRVDLFHYLHALVENRDRLMKNPELANEIAREKNLNAKYLRRMTDVLTDGNPSLLLRKIRDDL